MIHGFSLGRLGFLKASVASPVDLRSKLNQNVGYYLEN